jgi:hypothetical protein
MEIGAGACVCYKLTFHHWWGIAFSKNKSIKYTPTKQDVFKKQIISMGILGFAQKRMWKLKRAAHTQLQIVRLCVVCALVHREKALTWIDMCSLLSGKRRLFFARAPSPVTGNLLLSRRRRRRVTQNGPMKDEGAHCLRLCRFIESQAHARKAISASEKWLFSLWQSENERAIYGYWCKNGTF